jgi:hypothetical protein
VVSPLALTRPFTPTSMQSRILEASLLITLAVTTAAVAPACDPPAPLAPAAMVPEPAHESRDPRPAVPDMTPLADAGDASAEAAAPVETGNEPGLTQKAPAATEPK